MERSEAELLEIALGDARVADHYRRSHGLCVRHALAARAPLAREVTASRVELAGWELDEARRKGGWDYRHEPPEPEASAWRRVLALLDGATYLGGPALSEQ